MSLLRNVGSMAPSQIERNPTPLPRSSSIKPIKWDIERPKRSKRQTNKVSPSFNAARHLSKPGLSFLEPEILSV